MRPTLWIAVVLMLTGAVMLFVNSGASVIWFAAIAVGIALVAIERIRNRPA